MMIGAQLRDIRLMLSKSGKIGVVAANIVVALGVMTAAAVAPTSPFVAVVVAPWSGPEKAVTVVAAAQGTLVAPARFGWIVIAYSRQAGFISRLRKAGAWFVLDHKALSGCFPQH